MVNPGPLTLQIIVGSTRPTRAADVVVPWVFERASAHPAFTVEVLDLRDWPLPFFQEHPGSLGDLADPTFSEPVVKAWNDKLAAADAYVVVTPEYNHSIPAVLKNALDSVFTTYAMRNKALMAVGYGGGPVSGVRAIEHLVQIAVELEAAPIRSTVLVPSTATAFDAAGLPVDPLLDAGMAIALDDLAWWAAALATARADGELVPGKTRAAQARVALAKAAAEAAAAAD